MFDRLYNEFEKTNNVTKFYKDYADDGVSSRFLLIRSLDKDDISVLYNEKTGNDLPSGLKGGKPFKYLYETNITIERLVEYIESKREKIIVKRHQENEGLNDLINNFNIVNCGIETDKIDDVVKRMVRDKSIKTKEQFEYKLENNLLPKTANYVRWSFYNQITNDVIEEIFLRNNKVIPTLRKIHDIDFFVKIDNKIIPFDLKITHISSDFFNLYHKGLNFIGVDDDYEICHNLSEIEKVKEFYKTKKNIFNLPGYGGRELKDLLKTLEDTNDDDCIYFVNEMKQERREEVLNIANELHKLEWWNYKYQGPRLFQNNNRFFIFLAYLDSFEDGRALKGNIDEIKNKVNEVLENISLEKLHTIKYVYDKQDDINGNYESQAISAYIYGNKNQ